MRKRRHFENLNTARFVTFSCFRRYQLLTDLRAIERFLQVLEDLRQQYRFKLFGYVVMPEHVHLVLHPPAGTGLTKIIADLKSKSASRIICQRWFRLPGDCMRKKDGNERPAFWLNGFYDHNCRSLESSLQKIEYCHKNPVNRRLVRGAAEWPWSSYHWYQGRMDVPIRMDAMC